MAKILLVEDDQILINMYKAKLQNGSYEVLTAMDGEKGLETALQQHPELILLDIAMPKMDGMTVMKNLRQDPWGKNVPIIILTNLDTDDKIIKGVALDQPVYYLLKVDITPEGVLEKIKEILGGEKEAMQANG